MGGGRGGGVADGKKKGIALMDGGGGIVGLKGVDLRGTAGSRTVVEQLLLAVGQRPQLLPLQQRRIRADPCLVPATATLIAAASPDSDDKYVRSSDSWSCTS